MTIAQIRKESKAAIGRIPRDVLIVAVLILACLASFGLGLIAGRDGVGQESQVIVSPPAALNLPAGGQVVASVNGSKYYLPWCAGAITESNKIIFSSSHEAEAAGYTPASNCKAL